MLQLQLLLSQGSRPKLPWSKTRTAHPAQEGVCFFELSLSPLSLSLPPSPSPLPPSLSPLPLPPSLSVSLSLFLPLRFPLPPSLPPSLSIRFPSWFVICCLFISSLSSWRISSTIFVFHVHIIHSCTLSSLFSYHISHFQCLTFFLHCFSLWVVLSS